MSIKNIIQIKTNASELYSGTTVLSVLEEHLRAYQSNKVFLLVDENSLKHCVPDLLLQCASLRNVEILEIESGEANKTLEICFQLWKTLAAYNASRKDLLINLGGGVISDMGGFIASTYKRGMDFINIPTTLLAQIDASIGGKTGVDFEGLKNTIGVFNEPKAVFINPSFLKTLDKKQMLSGYAEALKHALIADANYWKGLKKGMLSDAEDWAELIATSLTIKNNIVLNDPFEKGERKLLNFGHTIGHALESYALLHDKTPLLHGEAVAVGMICESHIANQKGLLNDNDLAEITKTINSFYSPYQFEEANYHALIETMKHDKKNTNNGINFTLLTKIGEAVYDQEVQVELILEALAYYKTIINKFC